MYTIIAISISLLLSIFVLSHFIFPFLPLSFFPFIFLFCFSFGWLLFKFSLSRLAFPSFIFLFFFWAHSETKGAYLRGIFYGIVNSTHIEFLVIPFTSYISKIKLPSNPVSLLLFLKTFLYSQCVWLLYFKRCAINNLLRHRENVICSLIQARHS